MMRPFLLAVVLLGITISSAVAQDTPTPDRIYTALFKISYADIPQFMEDHTAVSVPILDEMVAEGMLVAHNLRMHHTGGEYNIRLGLVAEEGINFEDVWSTFLTRAAERDPATFARTNRMIEGHMDEIWDIQVSNWPSGEETRYVYDAQFQVNFADLEEWNRLWANDAFPHFDRAIDDGLLQGYVVEGHNTGGRFNWKILYLYDEWDVLDELEAMLFEAVPLDHPIWSMFSAHMDEIWQAPPQD
jgi:hypothetical protein